MKQAKIDEILDLCGKSLGKRSDLPVTARGESGRPFWGGADAPYDLIRALLKYFPDSPAFSGLLENTCAIVGLPAAVGLNYEGKPEFGADYIRRVSKQYSRERIVTDKEIEIAPGITSSQPDICDIGREGIFFDIGNIRVDPHDWEHNRNNVLEVADFIYKNGGMPVWLSGSHDCTIMTVEAFVKMNREKGKNRLGLISIDHHADLLAAKQGSQNSHSCVIRRCLEFADLKVALIGSGYVEAEEAKIIKEKKILRITQPRLRKALAGSIDNINRFFHETDSIYVTFDIDATAAAGTGCPEPFGIPPADLKIFIDDLLRSGIGKKIDGFDMVEVCEGDIMTAKAACEIVLDAVALLWHNHKKNQPAGP